jgi:hypothetical protein
MGLEMELRLLTCLTYEVSSFAVLITLQQLILMQLPVLTGGDGTVGDNPGTKQADQMTEHDHDFTAFSGVGGTGPNAQGNVTQATKTTAVAGAGTETRPTNVSLMFIIKT